jgi:hypothetical protein
LPTRRIIGGILVAVAGCGAILVAAIWDRSGATYRPTAFLEFDAQVVAGCWRLFDESWNPANTNKGLWFSPVMARLDTATNTKWFRKTGQLHVAVRLDSAGFPMDTAPHPLRDHYGGWGKAPSGKLWLSFQNGFGGPAFLFAWPSGHRRDTIHGTAGEFADYEPYFQRQGRAHAVRESCP